jgi:hypothetical protein
VEEFVCKLKTTLTDFEIHMTWGRPAMYIYPFTPCMEEIITRALRKKLRTILTINTNQWLCNTVSSTLRSEQQRVDLLPGPSYFEIHFKVFFIVLITNVASDMNIQIRGTRVLKFALILKYGGPFALMYIWQFFFTYPNV